MQARYALRLIVVAFVALAVAAVLIVVLVATDTLLAIGERLDRFGSWASTAYAIALAILAALFAGLLWYFLRPSKRRAGPPATPPVSREELEERLNRAHSRGVDTHLIERELKQLDQRRQQAMVYLAMFGAISAGKSSLINALLPSAQAASGPRGGTTDDIRYYRWQTPDEVPVQLVDLPGFGQIAGQTQGDLAREEALRAHVVLYVCDGDLSRSQYQELQQLAEFKKPLIVVINKADRYQATELEAIRQRLLDRLSTIAALTVVSTSAGGTEEVVVSDALGHERRQDRPRASRVGELTRAIERVVQADGARLEQGREASVLRLATAKLMDQEQSFRAQAAQTLVDRYSKRAVVGALAAVAPGSDLVIQGALATKLLRELCRLYEVEVKQLDLDSFISAASGRVRKTTAVTLAVAGNAMKAFPGLGTLAGGTVHAVAYGMIFQSLGEAVIQSLAQHGRLATPAIEQFEERLIEHLETRAGDFARLALTQIRQRDSSD